MTETQEQKAHPDFSDKVKILANEAFFKAHPKGGVNWVVRAGWLQGYQIGYTRALEDKEVKIASCCHENEERVKELEKEITHLNNLAFQNYDVNVSAHKKIDELQSKIEKLEKQKESWGNEYTAIILMKDEVEKMQSQLDKARECLDHIANNETIKRCCHAVINYNLSEDDTLEAHYERIAAETLEQIK